MNQVKAKIYYLIATGEILIITPEVQGDVTETTKEQDIKTFEKLRDKNLSEIDYIELEYGTLATVFTNIKSYSVDATNKKLNCIYYTKEELDAIKARQEQQLVEAQATLDRTSAITSYMQDNTAIMSKIEYIILESEKNKILNGGM